MTEVHPDVIYLSEKVIYESALNDYNVVEEVIRCIGGAEVEAAFLAVAENLRIASRRLDCARVVMTASRSVERMSRITQSAAECVEQDVISETNRE